MRPHILPILTLSCAASLALAQPALAGSGADSSSRCKSPKLEQPFSRFGDDAGYSLVPDGGLEQKGSGWSLSDGASVAGENEPYAVGRKNDKRSLDLAAGAAATTAGFCVTDRHTHLRLFVQRSGGSDLDTLGVTAVVTSADGTVSEHPLPGLSGGSWAPTGTVALAAELPELADQHAVDVSLRFAPAGDASWRLDDVYVDPPVRCC